MDLGDLVKDRINGFAGIVTGRATFITGCTQLLVASQTLKADGDSSSNWIDEVRLELVTPKLVALMPASGGPSAGPARSSQSPPK